jgi:Xaa-Pro dipeptidase
MAPALLDVGGPVPHSDARGDGPADRSKSGGMSAYPRFTDAEMERRRLALDGAMAAHEISHLLLYGANRAGSAIGWLTRWPVTREALVVHTPGERDLVLINFYNHLPNAAGIATDAEVRWAGEKPVETAIKELRRRGASGRVGTVGTLSHRAHTAIAAAVGDPFDMNPAYTNLRLIKSEEEIEWVRTGAALTDQGLHALHEMARPGSTELEIVDAVERAYVGQGGTTHIHYVGSTSMLEPALCVPRQYPTGRELQVGDVLICELSASYWDYTGQILRTVTIEAEPTPLYTELHQAADAAFEAVTGRLKSGATAEELIEASSVIEDAGFTIRDDLVHGFVGGYLPPVLGSRSRTLAPAPDFTFASGMTVVVQPNVVTRDETAGVQTGELLLVGDDGPKRLHAYGRGLLRAGPGNGYAPAPT